MYDSKSAAVHPTCESVPPPSRLKLNENEWRSKEGKGLDLVSIDVEALEEAAKPGALKVLEAEHVPFLGVLLNQTFQSLNTLDVVTPGGFPPVESSEATANPAHPLFPSLTNFCFKAVGPRAVALNLGDNLLKFLRNSPRLQVAFFGYGDRENGINITTSPAVSLPDLRLFTHESPFDTIPIGLFKKLTLKPTCDIAFTVKNVHPKHIDEPWDSGFFPSRRSPLGHLRDVKTVKITVRAGSEDSSTMVEAKFSNPNRTISLNRLTGSLIYSHWAEVIEKILDFLKANGTDGSVETLHFEHCHLDGPAAKSVLERMKKFAESRRGSTTPLKTVTLVFRDREELLKTCGDSIQELKRYVMAVEIVESGREFGYNGSWSPSY